MLQDLDVVRLNAALPEHGLEANARGTVVYVYGGGEVVEVEFLGGAGEMLGVVPVNADSLVLEVVVEPAHGVEAVSEEEVDWHEIVPMYQGEPDEAVHPPQRYRTARPQRAKAHNYTFAH